jgi:hypothetical protein
VLLASLALAGAAAVTATPSVAEAQTGALVVQMPFEGDATEELLHEVEDAVRGALLTRGFQGPDRSTVRGAMGVAPPTDTAGIVGFGRSMGGTHVLTGRVTPLTGQYNLELRLYEVATQRMAQQARNVGRGDDAAIAEMVAALFAPGALQPSPEERARQEAERQQQEAERRAEEERRRAEEHRRREEEARRRAEEERRRHEAEERTRRVYRYAEAGPISLGGAVVLGGRVSAVANRATSLPPPESLAAGLRLEGGYAVLPAFGLEVGGALLALGSPTNAFAVGPAARLALPARGFIPLRGSAGVALGLFQGLSGARATSAWVALDARAEYDVGNVTLFAGVVLDSMPGVLGTLAGVAGARFRFGETEAPPAVPSPSTSP